MLPKVAYLKTLNLDAIVQGDISYLLFFPNISFIP